MSKFINLKGKRFGRLVIVRRVKNDGKVVMWRCQCDCGNYVSVRSASLVHNRTKSCGCLHKEAIRKQPFYHIFSLLKRRDPEKKKCTMSFSEFLNFTTIKSCHYCGDPIEWDKYSGQDGNRHKSNLDRKDNRKGYSVTNCLVLGVIE